MLVIKNYCTQAILIQLSRGVNCTVYGLLKVLLRKGSRHIYAKRRFYLDEDSWQIVLADEYDSRGELWKVSIAYLKNFYELPTTWTALDTFHDLQSRRYHVQNLDNEESDTIDFSLQVPDDSYFKPAALRRRGIR